MKMALPVYVAIQAKDAADAERQRRALLEQIKHPMLRGLLMAAGVQYEDADVGQAYPLK